MIVIKDNRLQDIIINIKLMKCNLKFNYKFQEDQVYSQIKQESLYSKMEAI